MRQDGSLISVCLPVFNGEKFLLEAIGSVLEQTYSNFELVIIDDCSTDASVEIIESFARMDERIRFYRNTSRLGLFANYNECMLKADGEYIKPFAQDDVFHRRILEELLHVLSESKPYADEVVLVSCRRNWIDELGSDVSKEEGHPFAGDRFQPGQPISRKDILLHSVTPITNLIGEPSCAMFRRSVMGGGFDEGFFHLGDLEYWMRLLLHGRYSCTDKILCSIRHHQDRQTMKNLANLSFAVDHIALAKLWAPELEKLGVSSQDLIDSTVFDTGKCIRNLVTQGKVGRPRPGRSESEQRLELAFEALLLLGDDRRTVRPPSSQDRKMYLNERKIHRLERYVRSLLSDPGWHLTRPLREINRLMNPRSGDVELSVKDMSDRLNALEGLERQHRYIFNLKKTAVQVRFSRSWNIRQRFASLLQSERQDRSKKQGKQNLLDRLENLPYLQRKIPVKTSVWSAPLDELISARMHERVLPEIPRASILICACHDSVEQTLLALNHQSLPNTDFEVILVDAFESEQCRADVVAAVSSADFNLQLRAFRSSGWGRSAAHNLALRLSRSELIIFLAGDFVPAKEFVEAHLKFHLARPEKKVVGIGAGIFPPHLRDHDFRRWQEDTGLLFGCKLTPEAASIPEEFFYVGNSSVKKSFIASCGYFDEDFPDDALDDYEMGLRLKQNGMRAQLIPQASCLHEHPITLKERCRVVREEIARNAVIFDCKYAGVKDWHAKLRQAPAQHRKTALAHLRRYRIERNRADKIGYWQAMMDAKFVEGYVEQLEALLKIKRHRWEFDEADGQLHALSPEQTSTATENLTVTPPVLPVKQNVADKNKICLFDHRLVIIGFGTIGAGVLPLLLRHIEMRPHQIKIITGDDSGRDIAQKYGIEFIVEPLEPQNFRTILDPLLDAGDFLLNVSVAVSSVELIKLCQEKGVLYLDTSIEPWEGGYTDPGLSVSARSIYSGRSKALELRNDYPRGPTALLNHGANPGLISHLVKQALLNIARDGGIYRSKPGSRREWALLAEQAGVKVIHIAERDSQVARESKKQDEFANTWSIDGLFVEGSQPAELGWGTHERHFPSDGDRHGFGSDCAIYLNRPGASTRVRSWTPLDGAYQGFLIAHGEAISIADYLTIEENDSVRYRPTCHYAYQPCNDALLSLSEMTGKNWHMQPRRRLMVDEIVGGLEELGVLLMGPHKGVYWFGSRLSIDQARRLAPHNNATSLQVAAGVLAGVIWTLENPCRGIVEPEDIDFERVLEVARPYLGEVVGVYTDWTPLTDRNRLFNEDLDLSDPWQFKNIRVV